MREKLNGEKSPVEAVETALNDHVLLVKFIEDIHSFFSDGVVTTPRKAATATRQFCQQLIRHFAYEEEHIFPALVASQSRAGLVRQVAELRDEHDELEKKAKQLTKLVSPANLANQDVKALRQAVESLGDQMERHSAKENELFPSLL
jgi:iron-sulfur cluster repair protein YtfE (RIC family)